MLVRGVDVEGGQGMMIRGGSVEGSMCRFNLLVDDATCNSAV